MDQRIVITGEGIISSIGNDKEHVYTSLKNQMSGVRRMKYLNSIHTDLPVGEVQLSNEELKRALNISVEEPVSRTALLGIWAVKQAVRESRIADFLHSSKGSGKRVVLVSGTTVGGMDLTEQEWKKMHDGLSSPQIIGQHDCGSCTEVMARYFDFFADYTTISTACSSAANAIALGADLIKAGMADFVVAGGTEALSVFHLNGFNSLMILDKEICRPFDETRAGLNLGEGAGFVILESEASARSRGASVHGYINGYGNACDAFHQTASSDNGEGAYLAMKKAIEMSGLKESDIQYVNAHGTGTPNNDLSESVALQRVFGDRMPLVSSTKMYTGHTTSASGGIECVICLLCLQHHFIPSNLGWRNVIASGFEPTMGKESYDVCHILCNSFGFGGNDTSILISSEPSEGTVSVFDRTLKIKILSEVKLSSTDELTDIKRFVKPMEARRMGKLMKSALLSSLLALEKAGIEKPDAIITGTWWGCLENSELLMKQLEQEHEAMVKPTLFMQSTHNTIGSSIAIHTRCHGYNITFTQKDKSMDWALTNARLLLMSKRAKTILVGCHDETTPEFLKLMEGTDFEKHPEVESKVMLLSCGDY